MKQIIILSIVFLSVVFCFYVTKADSQGCLPNNAIVLPSSELSLSDFENLIENQQVIFSSDTMNQLLAQIDDCNSKLDIQLQEIENEISSHYLNALELFTLNKEVKAIPNRIETLNKNLEDSKFRYNWAINDFFHQYGIYAVLLENTSPLEDSISLSNKAEQALYPYVIDNLCKGSLKKLAEFVANDETKQIVDSYVACNVKNKEIFIAEHNIEKHYFLYVARYGISPETETQQSNRNEADKEDVFITEIGPNYDYKSSLLAHNVTEEDIELVNKETNLDVTLFPFAKYQVDTMNAFQLMTLKNATEKFGIHFSDQQNGIEELKQLLKNHHIKLENSFKMLGLTFHSDKLDQSIEKAFDHIRKRVIPLEKEWLQLKKGEVFRNSKVLNLQKFQTNPQKILATESLALYKSLLQSKYKFGKNEGVVKLGDIGVPHYDVSGLSRQVNLFREMERIHILASQLDNNNFKISVVAKFKIKEVNDILNALGAPNKSTGVFIDNRDGQSYKWVRLKDDKVWMAQNLNFKSKYSKCYNNEEGNCAQYGRLYSLNEARIACPFGWRLPANKEWDFMINAYGSKHDSIAPERKNDMKDNYKFLSDMGNSGFSTSFGGRGPNIGRDYYGIGEVGLYLSSNYPFRYRFSNISGTSVSREKYGYANSISCRCIIDYSKVITDLIRNSGYFTDSRDDQTYKWVRLKDGKKWMARNLNFNTDDSWCYRDDPNKCKKYGRLYSWKAAQNACPEGWRLPSDNEWWRMTNLYGTSENTSFGQALNKSSDAGRAAVKALNKGGESEFSAQFGGQKFTFFKKNKFTTLNDLGYYWSGSDLGPFNAWNYLFGAQSIQRFNASKDNALSCRCIQD